jgi:Zn-dependent alcohol dehydrogenase
MSDNKLNVAVIGLGNIGKVVATNLVKANREVIIASHKLEDANELASQLGTLAKASDVKTAIKNAEIVIFQFGSASFRSFSNNTQLNFRVRSLSIHLTLSHLTEMEDSKKSLALTTPLDRFYRECFQRVQNL